MSFDGDPLCCCEYFDIHQQRNHILLCCCNCEDLDSSFDSLLSGRQIPRTRVQGLMATLRDRLRIPWKGGAKLVALNAVFPIVIIPIFLLLATVSLWWTVATFSLMFFILSYLYFCVDNLKKTQFFFIWTLTSALTLFLVFEFIVIPFLEIYIHENLALVVLIIASSACFNIVKLRSNQLRFNVENELAVGEIGRVGVARTCYCSICKIHVPEHDHHCAWFDSCIGFHNRFLFLVGIILALAALLYSSNLTLTSVCHPFHFYKTILLPDDCSDVYEQFELTLSFVSAIYSLLIAAALGIFVVYDILLISFGLTGQEWRSLPICAKLCCGMTVHRPYSKGFFSNWFRVSCYCRQHIKPVSQY